MKVIQNVNIDKFENFRTFLKENPDIAGLTLETRAIYESQVGRNTVHIGPCQMDGEYIDRETRHYSLSFGVWREFEGLIGVQGLTDRIEH